MGFNGDNLKAIFDQRFGKGAFDSGVNQAYQNGHNQWLAAQQAQAQQDYLDQMKQQEAAQKAQQSKAKTYQDALAYWNDPTNKQRLIGRGIQQSVNDIQNDPQLQQEIKNAKFNKQNFIDAMYNVATNGKARSEKEYNQTKQGITGNFNLPDPNTVSTNPQDQQQQQQIAKEHANFLNGLQQDRAQSKAADDTLMAIHNDQIQRDVANQGVGNFGQELQRGIARAANQITFGGLGELDKKLHGGELSPMLYDRKGTAGWIDKGSDFVGSAIPFLLSDGATSAIGGAKLAALGEKGIVGKLGQLAIKGAGQGALVGVGQEGVKAGFNPQDFNAQQALKNVGTDALYGTVLNPLFHGAGGLLKQLNLNKQLTQVLEHQPTQIDPETFVKTLQDMKKPTGDVSNVVADQPKVMPTPFETRYNLKPQIKPEPTVKANDLKQNDWFNFTQQQKNIPTSRNLIPNVTVPKIQSGNVRSLADDTLNRSESFSNKPPKGFNQRLLDVQQEMKNLQNKTETIVSKLKGEGNQDVNYKPDPESLYQQVRQPSDPKTFDNLVKMAEMEHNQANPSLTTMLRLDPRIKQSISKLNELGKPTVVAPKIEPTAKPKVKLPELKSGPQNPHDLLQSLKVNSKESIPEGEPKQGNKSILVPLNLGDNSVKSIKTDKMLPSMNKAELQDTLSKLEKQEELYKGQKGKKAEAQLKQIQKDKEKVNEFLMKMDLQKFGEKETPQNPLDAPYNPGDTLPDTSSHIGTKTKKPPLNIKETANKGYIKTVDNLHRLSQFDKQVEQVLGKDLNASEKTHTLGLNSRGSDMISKQILTQNMVDKNGEVVGDSLKDIAKNIPKGKLNEFEDYLVNQHAITRMGRGEKVFPDEMNMTTGKSEEIVKNYEANNPKFKVIAEKYYKYNEQLGQKWLVDTGILSKADWEGYLKANPYYVPNNRIFSNLEMPKLGNSAKKGFANQANPVKKAAGSQRQIVSPIESTIEHTAQYVKTAKRNEVMQTLINNIKQNPEAFKGWAEIVPTEKGAGTYLDSVSNKLKDEGIDAVLDEFNKAFDQKTDLTKGNIVAGIIDGRKVHVRVNDPHLLDALTNLQPKAQNIIISALGQVTRKMKVLTTGINPVFSLTRNIFRDIPTAFANSKSTNNPLTFSKDLVSSVISVMKNDELYRSFKAVGGGHASPISSDINLLAQSKRSILPQKGLVPLLGKGLGALENLNNAVESAPRLAEFKRLAGDSYDSKMKALYEANDVTVNFNKFGNVSKEIDSVVPYFNAAIQGLDKTGRSLLNPKTAPATIIKAFAAITIPSIIEFAANHNNPDYQKLSNYIKDNNIVIPKGDGTFYKIPVPRELGMVFHGGVTRTLKAWVDHDPKAFAGFANQILTTFLPPIRTVAAPVTDLRSNKNYMGAPIVPADLQGLSPRFQYDAQTSEPSKAIGNMLNVSPKQIDYLIKSYGGVLGQLGIPATTKNGSIGQTLNQQITADPVFSNDIMSNFYNQKAKLDQAHANFSKQGITTGDLNEGLRKMMDEQSTRIANIRKQSKSAQNDPSLTPKQRLARIRQLQDMMNQIASQNVR